MNRANGWVKKLILIAFALSGMTALVYEVAWTRPLQIIFGSTIYAVGGDFTSVNGTNTVEALGICAANSYSSITVVDDQVGTSCDTYGNGGQRVQTGLDDGLPSNVFSFQDHFINRFLLNWSHLYCF